MGNRTPIANKDLSNPSFYMQIQVDQAQRLLLRKRGGKGGKYILKALLIPRFVLNMAQKIKKY